MHAIAHILDTPIERHGGLNLLVRELAMGQSSRYAVYVFCPENTPDPGPSMDRPEGCHHCPWPSHLNKEAVLDFLKETIKAHRIEAAFFHGGEFGRGFGSGSLKAIQSNAPRVACIYVNHQSSSLLFCRLAGVYRPDLPFVLRSALKFWLLWLRKMFWLSSATHEISVSSFERRQARRRYFPHRRKFMLIYHSRLPARLEPPSPVTKEKIILNAGHLAYRKGQHVLLRAFGEICRRHPAWKLVFLGAFENTAYQTLLENLVAEYQIGDRVVFVDEIRDPQPYFQKASIYVQPSLLEAYGLALQEAMRFGCACVGSDTGGIPESVLDSTCRFPPGHSVRLSKILDALMSDPIHMRSAQSQAVQDDLRMNRGREQMLEKYDLLLGRLFNS